MWTYKHSDEIYHHGVKGMKWGVKKSSSTIGSGKKSKPHAVEDDKKNKIKKIKKAATVGGAAATGTIAAAGALSAIGKVATSGVSAVSKVGQAALKSLSFLGESVSSIFGLFNI